MKILSITELDPSEVVSVNGGVDCDKVSTVAIESIIKGGYTFLDCSADLISDYNTTNIPLTVLKCVVKGGIAICATATEGLISILKKQEDTSVK